MVVVEEDDEEVGTAEDDIPVKSSNEEVWQDIEMLLTYSLFTENWEIVAITMNIPLLFNQSSLASQSK